MYNFTDSQNKLSPDYFLTDFRKTLSRQNHLKENNWGSGFPGLCTIQLVLFLFVVIFFKGHLKVVFFSRAFAPTSVDFLRAIVVTTF